ncbi:carbohydrate sulfotransferase 11-like [Oratosquilla oratoria]|uniref:carbohydrate sulfotransferase 11-like n=1 Tax=Oratosquilla oratoria TaxID=337810 RepID=UPI003F766829
MEGPRKSYRLGVFHPSTFFQRLLSKSRKKWKPWLLALALYIVLQVLLIDEEQTNIDSESLEEWVKQDFSVSKSSEASSFFPLRQKEPELKEEYASRNALAKSVCEKYGVYSDDYKEGREKKDSSYVLPYSEWITLKKMNYYYMYYSRPHDFVYCKVPKSGSSTWVYNLLKLAHVPEETISSDIGLHAILRDYYPRMSRKELKQVLPRSFKLVVVRHPFDRILSAYRDKLEDYQRDLRFRNGFYYTMYGKNIVQIFRDHNDATLVNRTEPTWREFVEYIISTPSSKFDEHWMPIYNLCSPCFIRYNLIAKMDTFSEDTQYAINQMGLEDQLKVEWIHKTGSHQTSEVAQAYFSKLTKTQVDQLFFKYRVDFELFGYEYDDYYEMAHD